MYDGYENDYGRPLLVNGKVALYKKLQNPPIKWLIHEVLKERGIGVLYGSSGSMKSYSAVDLACRMVNGMDFHGRPMERGEVIYVAGEAAEETDERIDMWLEYHGKTERPFVCPWAIQLHDLDQMQDLITLIKQVGNVRLVIFDNLADCSVGVKLSDPDDVGERIKPAVLSFVKESKAAMLMLHHTGHDESHERGAKVIRDMADTTIKATKGKNMFDLEWKLQKVRRRPEGQVINLHIKDISDVVGIPNAAIILGGKRSEAARIVDYETGEVIDEVEQEVQRTAADELAAYIRSHGGDVNARDVQMALGWWNESKGAPSQTYYDALNELKKEGLTVEGRGKQARLFFPTASDASGIAA